MKRLLLHISFILLPIISMAQKVVNMKLSATINPVTADYIRNGIQKATEEKAQCLVIELNTPGGLLASTRDIVRDILQAPIPVVVFVHPGGSQAGSAGVFITMAAHIAAMAPGTNIGAAHPVGMQGSIDTIMNEKTTNDAAAFIRSIAQKRNRNLEWAEEAVRKSVSITENEALDKRVIDLVATNTTDLLMKINGRSVIANGETKILNTANASVLQYEMGLIERVLNILSDPNIAYILMMIGMYGIMFELYSPGTLFPGIIGVISLILAFYSMHTLPINYAGLALIVFSIILFILELKIISHGLLGIGGIISLLLGSMMLIRSDSALEFASISLSVILTSTIITALFFIIIIGAGLKAQRIKPVTGKEGMIGLSGEALDILSPDGRVMVEGEIWNATSISGNIDRGGKVIVKKMKDLILYVEPMHHI